tara:strand:+ start:8695 stop:9222 length:528 start_codon:yes stop_codon:yes gene_type:complete
MTYLTLNEINSNAKYAPLGHDNKESFINRLNKELINFKCSILLNYVESKWTPEKIKTQEALKKLSEKTNINFFKLLDFVTEKWIDEVIPDYFDSEPSYNDEYDEEETYEQFCPAYGEFSRRLGKTAESRRAVNKIWIFIIKKFLNECYKTVDYQDINNMLNEVITSWSPEYVNLY